MSRLLPLLALLAACQDDFRVVGKDDGDDPSLNDTDPAFGIGLCGFDFKPKAVDPGPACSDYSLGSFTPWVEWHGAPGKSSSALPVVADLDGDGFPEILVNIVETLQLTPKGQLWVYDGSTGQVKFRINDAQLGYGSPVAVGDLDGDGFPEIVGVRALGAQSPGPDFVIPYNQSKYALVAWDNQGNELWQSDTYYRNDFDYASAPIISDMDHDGSPEIVVGRVIFNADGTTRGVGSKGRGSWGKMLPNVSEATVPAVADLDLDGIEEVIVGNAMYDPDGNTIWEATGPYAEDGMVAVANLDDDPEGEFIVSTFGTVRAYDTDGTLLWRRQLKCEVPACVDDPSTETLPVNANIVSVPAVADIDNDGWPEIIVAGGSQVAAFNHDGTELWRLKDVQDVSGATGVAIFDFDADGTKEVVYADEIALYGINGLTGQVVFRSDEHRSATMMDYPVVADVDADGSAEVIVTHMGYGAAFTVYGAADGVWAPTRKVWNQHAYSINNIDDDLGVPVAPVQGFEDHNTWHAAAELDVGELLGRADLTAELLDVCRAECNDGWLHLAVRVVNRSPDVAVDAGVKVTLYAKIASKFEVVETKELSEEVGTAHTSGQIIFSVPADIARKASEFGVVVDDDGTGHGTVPECVESDNVLVVRGRFCR